MKSQISKVKLFEIIGVFIILLIGTVWHNLYPSTGDNFLVGMFAPVNESMWEHWKIGYWPILIYALIEYPFIKDYVNNFVFAKAMSILALDIVTFGGTALYEIIIGPSDFKVHIIMYILGIIAAQIVSYLIMTRTEQSPKLNLIGWIVLILHGLLLIAFTFNPPRYDYFKDPFTGTYGIFKRT